MRVRIWGLGAKGQGVGLGLKAAIGVSIKAGRPPNPKL